MEEEWIDKMQVDLSYSFKTADEAFGHMMKDNRTIELHNISSKGLWNEIKKFYQMVEEYNQTVESEELQILPSYPYEYRGIKGCLGVKCAEISCGTFKDNADKISLFTGWNYTVLKNPSLRKPLSEKALVSLAMLGSMV